MSVGGRALLALPALTSRTVETAGRNTAGNLDLAFWHGDSREFEGEAASIAWARAVWGPLIAKESAPTGGMGKAIAEELRQLLSARFDEDWSLARLQSYFGVSAFRLCRTFRRATGSGRTARFAPSPSAV